MASDQSADGVQIASAQREAQIESELGRGAVYWSHLLGIVVIHIGAAAALHASTWTTGGVVAFLAMWWLVAGLGISLGYHRLLAHRSYQTSKPVEYILSWLGSLALQGGPIKWVATHRVHHRTADRPGDPHSPQRSFFWGHCGWVFFWGGTWEQPATYGVYAPELARDPVHVLIERWQMLSQLLVAGVLYLAVGVPGVVWGVFVRLVFVYHTTWLVNSAAHRWGTRATDISDNARNLWWLALITWGEGWHNNHHASPSSARHGWTPWQIDVSWLTLRLLAACRLVRGLRTPVGDGTHTAVARIGHPTS